MDISTELKKEMPFKWRVQSCNSKCAICVAYIDARDVMDVLDNVVGFDKWQDQYKEIKGSSYCGIGIKINDEWVWKWDCGSASNIEAQKGEASDSFKRAAVKWGIGRFLYSKPIKQLWDVKSTNNGKYVPINPTNGKPFYGDDLTNYINGDSIKDHQTHKPIVSKPKTLPVFALTDGIKKVIIQYRKDGLSLDQIMAKIAMKFTVTTTTKGDVKKVYESKQQ